MMPQVSADLFRKVQARQLFICLTNKSNRSPRAHFAIEDRAASKPICDLNKSLDNSPLLNVERRRSILLLSRTKQLLRAYPSPYGRPVTCQENGGGHLMKMKLPQTPPAAVFLALGALPVCGSQAASVSPSAQNSPVKVTTAKMWTSARQPELFATLRLRDLRTSLQSTFAPARFGAVTRWRTSSPNPLAVAL